METESLARPAPPAPLPAPDAVEPLTAELTRLHVTVPRRLLAKLEAPGPRCLTQTPGAGMAEILEAGLDVRTRARGGPHAAANLVTVCGFHHDLETHREFGDAPVDRCMREKRERVRTRRSRRGEARGTRST